MRDVVYAVETHLKDKDHRRQQFGRYYQIVFGCALNNSEGPA